MPPYVQKGLTYIPNGKPGGKVPMTGLRSCCKKPFHEDVPGNTLGDECECANPSSLFLVECVSCDMHITGQHGCETCGKVTCNFCLREEDGDPGTQCYLCAHGAMRPTTRAEECVPPEEDPLPGTCAVTVYISSSSFIGRNPAEFWKPSGTIWWSYHRNLQ